MGMEWIHCPNSQSLAKMILVRGIACDNIVVCIHLIPAVGVGGGNYSLALACLKQKGIWLTLHACM